MYSTVQGAAQGLEEEVQAWSLGITVILSPARQYFCPHGNSVSLL